MGSTRSRPPGTGGSEHQEWEVHGMGGSDHQEWEAQGAEDEDERPPSLRFPPHAGSGIFLNYFLRRFQLYVIFNQREDPIKNYGNREESKLKTNFPLLSPFSPHRVG